MTYERRVRRKGTAEMLINCRLGILGELVAEFGLKLGEFFALGKE